MQLSCSLAASCTPAPQISTEREEEEEEKKDEEEEVENGEEGLMTTLTPVPCMCF